MYKTQIGAIQYITLYLADFQKKNHDFHIKSNIFDFNICFFLSKYKYLLSKKKCFYYVNMFKTTLLIL